jgi:hypothetical protein
MKKRVIKPVVIVLGVAGIAVAWWLFSPLLISQSVDEEFPFTLPNESEITELSPNEAEEILTDAMEVIDEEFVEELGSEKAQELEETILAVATMMPDHPMDEEMPEVETEWKLVRQGQFQDADAVHRGSGLASIFELGDQRVLRFEDFEVTNGPDLHVLLVENLAGTNHDAIGRYIDLGSLKGNLGNQNYEIMTNVDLSLYEGVMIYCMPFHVVFATAALP